MSTRPKILIVSWDRALLQARELILGIYFETATAGKMAEAQLLILSNAFEPIVICDMLSDRDCREIENLIHCQNPRPAAMLLLAPGQKRADAIIGKRLSYQTGPLKLLLQCAELLGCKIKPRQGARSRMAAA
jgi:hypothetical protein